MNSLVDHIVLLRGINVGGHNRLPMADLRNLLTNNGYTSVSTYIQSGNILLSSEKNSSEISTHIQKLIGTEFSYNIPVITLTTDELKTCFLENPYLKKGQDIKFLHVTFLEGLPKKELLKNLNINTYNNDAYQIIGKCIYLHTPDGFAKTKFNNIQFEKKLNTITTTRNWRTVSKLVTLLETT